MTAERKKLGAMEWLRAFADRADPEWDGDRGAPGGGLTSVIVQLVGRIRERDEWLRSKRWPGEKEMVPLSASDVKSMLRTNQESMAELRAVSAQALYWRECPESDLNGFDPVTEAVACGLIAGREISRGNVAPWMPFARRGIMARAIKQRGPKKRAEYYRDVEHKRVREDFIKRRKAAPKSTKRKILQAMEARKGSQQLRQLYDICKGLV